MTAYAPFDAERVRANVPPELRALPVWLRWRAVPRDGKEKPDKVPYYANGKRRTGELDSPADRAKLVPFERALEQLNSRTDAGLGVALGPVSDTSLILSGIDLDNSVKGEHVAPNAKAVIDAAHGSYAEISPSLGGLKIFGTGDIGKEAKADLEIYSRARFFTFTGERIDGYRLADLTDAAATARRLLLQHDARAAGGAKFSGPIPEGGRNNALFAFACSLRARDMPEGDAWQLLQRRNLDCSPPLDERELRQLFDRAWKYAPDFKLTDLGNAERLVARHGDDLRHVNGIGWATFADHRWNLEHGRPRVMVMMADVVRGLYVEASKESDDTRRKRLADHARASESRKRLEAAVALAEWQPPVVNRLDDYDTDPLLLGLRNGVYDLRRDEFRPGRREDRITLQAAVAYDARAKAPRWEQFQSEIHDGDADMVAFKQRAWGYTLSGETSEQKLFMPYGEGANGKTTEQNVVQELMADYARKIEPETLLVRDRRGASNDIARLRGARFVPTVEVEDGGRLAESLVKQLTGRDRLATRFLYKEFFEFRPTGKIWLATNHRPDVKGTDYAIWRRILLIPYTVRFSGARCDPRIEEKLVTEAPGILNWMIDGFRAWQRIGLAPPASVLAATDGYRSDMDRIGSFLRECCRHGPEVKGRTRTSYLYGTYVGWAKASGIRWLSRQHFYDRLARDHGLHRVDGDAGALKDIPHLVVTTTEYDSLDA